MTLQNILRASFAVLVLSACSTMEGCVTASASRADVVLPVLQSFHADPDRAGFRDLWPESLVYAGLFQFDAGMNVIPDLAVAMPTISPGGKRYTFALSPAARFADGRRVTAADVAFSLARALSRDEHSRPGAAALSEIAGSAAVVAGAKKQLSGITVQSKLTLQIRLRYRDPDFLADLALPVAAVLDRSDVTGKRDWWLDGASAGPFRISSLGAVDSFEPNPYYLEGKLAINGLQLRPVGSVSAAMSLFNRNLVDATPVPAANYASDSRRSDFLWTDNLTAYYLSVPNSLPSVQRLGVAQAINDSDLQSASSQLDPLSSLVPTSVIPGYPAIATAVSFQPGASHSALSSSGVSVDIPTPLARTAVGRWTITDFGSLGLKSAIGKAKPGVRLIRVGPGMPVAADWLDRLVIEAGLRSSTLLRSIRAASRVDISQGLGTQISDLEHVESLVLTQNDIVPIAVQKQGYLVSPKLQGMVVTPLGLEPSAESWTSVSYS